MKIPGLHHLISQRRAAAGAAARQARESDPRTQHELNCSAEKLAIEAEALCEYLHGDEELIESILPLIRYIGTSPHKSETRKDALAHLKAAAGLLYLEIGTPEPERNFEILPPTPKANGHAHAAEVND